jgi:protein TonB
MDNVMETTKRPFKIFPLVFCLSLGIHIAAFIFFRFDLAPQQIPAVGMPAYTLSLLNLSFLESAPEQPVAAVAAPLPAPKILPPKPPVEAAPDIPEASDIPEAPAAAAAEFVAEQYITVDRPAAPAPVEAAPIPAALTYPEAGGSAGSAAGAAPATTAAAEDSRARVADYVRRNYSYIQRRIRDSLVYPAQARRTSLQGTAELVFTVNKDGTVSGLGVRVSSGEDILDQAALEAVRTASPFRPPPAPARIVIPVAFKLK